MMLLTMTGLSSLSAEVWVRGAAVGLAASGGVRIDVPANGQSFTTFDALQYFPGIFNCRAEPGGEVLMQLSNRMRLAFRGEGFFAVERMESILEALPAKNAALEVSRERVILNLRRGELILDSRGLTDAAKLILETPFGRIHAVSGVLLVQIQFDQRSGIYDFTISSAEGTARLYDLRGQSYDIFPGQRLSGAGSYLTPAIEVGEQMAEIREKFQNYLTALDAFDPARIDAAQLQAHLSVLSEPAQPADASRSPVEREGKRSKRPRVIEFAPAAEPFSPFRAEVEPPSDFEADLF